MWQSRGSSPKTTNQTTGNYATGLVTAAVAACAAYLLDPRSGGRRRALLRDKFVRATHVAREFIGKASRDAQHRARGLRARSAAWLRPDNAHDERVAERVRTELGRLSTHPGAIEVSCVDGVVRLQGDVLEYELNRILRGVGKVRGVREVVNEARVHANAGRIPALQGGNGARERRPEFLQKNWAPAPRLLAGLAGTAMIVTGIGRRSAAGLSLAAGGIALLGRSITNMPLSHFIGLRADDSDGVLVQKTINVYADPDEVYSCWRDLERLPQFMTHVRSIRQIDERRYHWTVDGPAGVPVEWDSEITADVPGQLLAWRTLNGSVVHTSGIVQFEPTSYGSTRVHVRMSYRPPANRVGHTVAKVLGRDPKRQLDADLQRFKSYIELSGGAGVTGSGDGGERATRRTTASSGSREWSSAAPSRASEPAGPTPSV